MIAGGRNGAVEAMCLNEKGPLRHRMTTERNGCQFGRDAPFGAIDAPGNGGAYNKPV